MRRSAVAGALLWLNARQWRNRARRQLARVRQPRYLVATLLGAAYMYWALFSNNMRGESPFARLGDSAAGPVLASVFALFLTARRWLARAERGALAFSQAELQLLFPAPLTRAALVHAKLLRTQFTILLNVLIWTVLLRGDGGTGEGWRRGIALWVLFSTLSLHGLGAALVRLPREHDGRTGRFDPVTLIPRLVIAAVVGSVLFALWRQETALLAALADGPLEVLEALQTALAQPVAQIALAPIRWLVAPVFAIADAGAWLRTIAPALAVLAAHYVWVVRTDSAFEEAAFDASRETAERIDRRRRTTLGSARSKRGRVARIPALPAWAPAAAAITWKNVAAGIRAGAWRQQLVLFGGLLAVFAYVATRSDDGLTVLTAMTSIWGAMLVFAGPLWTRFDLRMDLPQLEVLKVLPLSGRAIVAASIAGAACLQTLALYLLGAVPAGFLLSGMLDVDRTAVLPVIVAIAIALPGVVFMTFVAHNVLAVLYPSWVKLGGDNRGFEAFGQNLLTMGVTFLGSAVAAVLPGLLGVAVLFGLRPWLDDWSLVLASLIAAAALLGEMVPILAWIGDVFDRTDLADVGPTGD